jgi:DNA-binding NarL/FixJ family response regulator
MGTAQPWTEEDELLLLEMRAGGKTQYAIAKRLGRTESAINCRVSVMLARERQVPASAD